MVADDESAEEAEGEYRHEAIPQGITHKGLACRVGVRLAAGDASARVAVDSLCVRALEREREGEWVLVCMRGRER